MAQPSSPSKRSTLLTKLLSQKAARESYIRSTLNILVPSQIKALRLRALLTQKDLGIVANMKQARISDAEKPGKVAFTLETLIRLAAAFEVGLQVHFVPFSQMLEWENGYSQDAFNVTKLKNDHKFLNPQQSMPSEQQEAIGLVASAGRLQSLAAQSEYEKILELSAMGHLTENMAAAGGSTWQNQ